MTTDLAAASYLAQHLHSLEGRGFAVHNPHNKPLIDLPTIYGFNNTKGGGNMLEAVAIAEDGTCLGGHCCSAEGYMPHDLGMLDGTRPDRHTDAYQKHYPDGYRMEFVPSEDISAHLGLNEAFRLNTLANKT